MRKVTALVFILALMAMAFVPGQTAAQELEGTIQIDGSSTVYPVTQAMAEEFSYEHPRVRVTVGVSGSGGGFAKFNVGETDLSNASREINQEEAAIAEENGIEFTQFVVGYDGITVVVHPENDWVDDISTDELKMIWEPGSEVDTWSDVRAEWPDEEIELYAPGADSGTFDYFTEAINGEAGSSRSDFTASEDDNVLVRGVAGNRYALGYFGYAYYEENSDSLKALAVDGVMPSPETIGSQEYQPLARPLFLYAKNSSLQRPEVKAFLKFYFENAPEIIPEVGYSPLTSYENELETVEELSN